MVAIKLSQLTAFIGQALNTVFEQQTFWVIADVTNHNYKAQDDWHFFTLAEKQEGTQSVIARMEAVAWKAGAIQIRDFEKITGQRFQNNISVLVNVSVEFSGPHGLKLRMHGIDPNYTIGALEQAKQATLARLLNECPEYIRKSGERYYTRNNQLQMRAVIERIAIIASDETAGYEDFIHTLERNVYGYTFIQDTYFTPVQGINNAGLLRDRLIEIYRSGIAYDAVVLIRGGGSQTDFLLFDSFSVAQAIAKFPIPVITGIGHQRNETIADMMAHSPLHAPTKAAEFIISHNQQFEQQLLHFQRLVVIRSQQVLSNRFQLLSQLEAAVVNGARNSLAGQKDDLRQLQQATVHRSRERLYAKQLDLSALAGRVSARPGVILASKAQELRYVLQNLQTFARLSLARQSQSIGHLVDLFRVMSPASILKRGFAIVKKNDQVVSDPQLIQAGDELSLLMTDQDISVTVQAKKAYNGQEFNL